MSSIDDKLREVIRYIANEDGYVEPEDLDNAIAQIKQVFADEGYLPHVDCGKHVKVGDKLYITNGNDPLVKLDLAKYMTGREWYDRFEKEAGSCTHYIRSLFASHVETASKADEREMFVKQDILQAAKKAAGVE